MSKLTKLLPIGIVVLGVVLIGVAMLIGTQQDVAPDTPLIGDLLDVEDPFGNPREQALERAIDRHRQSSGSASLTEEPAATDWYHDINGLWNYTNDDGYTMRANIGNGTLLLQQVEPIDNNNRENGRWRLLDHNDESATLRFIYNERNSELQSQRVYVTIIDELTLKVSFEEDPEKIYILNKVFYD